MTLKEFNTTLFTNKTKVLYEGKEYPLSGVDFMDDLIGIHCEDGNYITWINYTECLIVKAK